MKNVIFDFGNVVIQWRPYRALSHLFETEAEMQEVLDRTGFVAWNAKQDLGRSWEDGIAEMRRTAPDHTHVYEAYAAGLKPAHGTQVPGTSAIIERLHAQGIGLYGLTNAARASFEAVLEAAPALRLMRDIVVSGDEGITKPDPAIFELCLKRNGLAPEDCLFVDDSAANCAAAETLGIAAIRFTDADALEQGLVARGLL